MKFKKTALVLSAALALSAISPVFAQDEPVNPAPPTTAPNPPQPDQPATPPSTPTPQPEKPADPKPETPTDPNPEKPADPKPENPSDPKDKDKDDQTPPKDNEEKPNDANEGSQPGNNENPADNHDENNSTTSTEEQTTTVAPTTPRPDTRPPHRPTVPQPSNNPNQYQPVQPVQPVQPAEEVLPEVEEVTEPINLLEGDFITFNANVYQDEAEADRLIQMIEEDEATKDRFVAEKEIVEDGEETFILVRVTYAEDIEEDGRYILFYVPTNFEDQMEAQEYLQEQMNRFPDVFIAGQIVTADNHYNVIFGIRPGADTQQVLYDEETYDVLYQADRKEYTYTVQLNPETGSFDDPIQEAVEKAFPGEFTFTTNPISETEVEVTMTPVPQEEEANEDSQLETIELDEDNE